MARWSRLAAGAILVTFAGTACAKRTTVRDDPDTTTDAAVDAGQVGAKGTAGTIGELPGEPGDDGARGREGTPRTPGGQGGVSSAGPIEQARSLDDVADTASGTKPGERVEDDAVDPRSALSKLRRLDRMAIEIALMVERRVTAPPVDALATRMVEDHAAIERRLQAFEESSDVPIRMHPNGIVRGPAEYETIESLRGLEGDRFERAFLQWILDSHREVLAEIDGIAARTEREDLRRLLEEVEPVLREHMDMAANAMTATEREQVRGEEEPGDAEVRGAD